MIYVLVIKKLYDEVYAMDTSNTSKQYAIEKLQRLELIEEEIAGFKVTTVDLNRKLENLRQSIEIHKECFTRIKDEPADNAYLYLIMLVVMVVIFGFLAYHNYIVTQ